jgi:hypothetical protein
MAWLHHTPGARRTQAAAGRALLASRGGTPPSPSLSQPSPAVWYHPIDCPQPTRTGIRCPRCHAPPFFFPFHIDASRTVRAHPLSPRPSIHSGLPETPRAAGFWLQCHHRPVLPVSSARATIVPHWSPASHSPLPSSSCRAAGTPSPATRASPSLECHCLTIDDPFLVSSIPCDHAQHPPELPQCSPATPHRRPSTDLWIGQPVCWGLCQEPFFSGAVALLNSVDDSVKGCYMWTM